jgi:hypothetical protein
MPYFLDGNNLIGLARRTPRPSDEDRVALVSEIADRLRRTKAKAVVFFDGGDAKGSRLGALSVRGGGPLSADDQIVNEIARSANPREITVVTADRGLARRVSDLAANVIAPAEFWKRVGRSRAPSDVKPDERPDVEEWMRYFADDRNRGKP